MMKGISPLIASVLLIAFTVSVAMIVMGWFSGFTKTTTENISNSAVQGIDCSSASVDIDHIYITGTSAIIILKNTGSVGLQATGMIINTTGGSCVSSTTTITQGNTTSLSLTGCYPAAMGGSSCLYFSKAIITTSCSGVEDSITSNSKLSCSVS